MSDAETTHSISHKSSSKLINSLNRSYPAFLVVPDCRVNDVKEVGRAG